jgi:hypothetical protein
MRISYAITVCNELDEIKRLVPFLHQYKRPEDEIVILWDENGDINVYQYLIDVSEERKDIRYYRDYFQNHFAEWKNKLTSVCKGDYIFQIDADELPNELLIENLHIILENNQSDIILVPRVNIVQGITPQHLQAWGWKQNEKGWIQWPDHQWRIYKNIPEIKWENKLHEVLNGYKTYANLPEMEEYALYHYKTIERQEKQNNYYNQL